VLFIIRKAGDGVLDVREEPGSCTSETDSAEAIAERLDIRPVLFGMEKPREVSGRERNVTRNVTLKKPDELTDQPEHSASTTSDIQRLRGVHGQSSWQRA
jgi:hypothetical protein